jgi:cell division protein FtsI (penicillin-binding protein 3)
VTAAALVAVVVTVWKLQVGGAGELVRAGVRQRMETQELAADRGIIVDRTGAELALSVQQATVWTDPRLVRDVAGTAAALAPLLGVDAASLAERLTGRAGHEKFSYLARQVPDTVATAVKALTAQTETDPILATPRSRYPGVFIISEPRRFYPGGDSARAVLGATNLDGVGLYGIEKAFDSQLAGQQGELRRETDTRGRTIPVGTTQYVAPTQGDDLQLTLDRSLQYYVEQALLTRVKELSAKGGVAIVMVPSTGDVLAMASVATPAADPAAPEAVRAPRLSRGNDAVVSAYEPGSVNKVITAAAAVELGIAAPDTVLAVPAKIEKPCGDKTFKAHDQGSDERWPLSEIIAKSSNTGVIALADQIGKVQLDSYLRGFGLGARTGVGLPNESPGSLLSPKRYNCLSLATISIGQGVSVTPLQMVSVYATIANGGVRVPPRLVSARIDSTGATVALEPQVGVRAVSTATAAAVTAMLDGVVSDTNGTGRRAAIDGYRVAGKTGTALKPQPNGTYFDDAGKPHYFSSFAGFAPAEHPEVVVLAAIDEPSAANEHYYAAFAAAPLFHDITTEALRTLKVAPRNDIVVTGSAPERVTTGDKADVPL